MLFGTVLYYRNGRRLPEMDTGVTSEYARRASQDDPGLIVEWTCSNWDGTVLSFQGGRELPREATNG